ncbi:MAG: hypothetical protein Q9170_003020 [Blastenia crenularia]
MTQEIVQPYVTDYKWRTTWHHSRKPASAQELQLYPLGWYVRDQVDLQFVRREMAVGLLRTCKQIYAETLATFYGRNDFQFLGCGGWQGLLRFFLTLGPNARRHIHRILVSVPLGVEWCYGRVLLEGHNNNFDGRSKNKPEMRMAKIQPEGPEERLAVRQVCEIMMKDNAIQDLALHITSGSYMGDQVFDSYRPGWKGLLEIQDMLKDLVFCNRMLVVDKGALLGVRDAFTRINNLEWDLCFRPGSLVRDPDQRDQVRQLKDWEFKLYIRYRYLEGIPTLFGATNEQFDASPDTRGIWEQAEQLTVDRVLHNLSYRPKPNLVGAIEPDT